MAQEEILYERAHVAIRDCFPSKDSSPNRSKDITGKVSIVETSQGIFFRFKPTGLDDRPTDDWALVSETNSIVSYKNSGQERDSIAVTPNPLLKYRFNINLNNIRSIKRNQLLHGITYLTFVLKDGTTLPIFYFNLGGTKELVHLIQIYIHLEKSSDDAQLYIVKDENVSAFDQLNLFDNSNDMLKRIRGTHTRRTAMDKFSKLTNFVRDTVLGQNEIIRTGDNLDDAITPDLTALMESFSAELRESNNDGFEVIYKVDFKKLPKVNRGSPLTSQEWAESLDEKGRVIDVKQLKERIFRGGLESNELRREVWKFLLNFYSWSSTKRERIELAKQREAEYFAMKLQWKSMNDRQKKRNTLFRDRESLIDKDVIRTDRTHEYFEGERNPHLEILHDILMTYNMFNFDLGYVQGMNDLLSPILIVMENEVDAFWCFVGLMERMQKNFHMDQSHIKRQLGNLHTLLQFIDAELANYLVENNSSNMYFFFRWMLICFKREFSFEDVMYLWEVLWTDNLCENFELLVCLAILISQKSAIMESKLGCCEILKHINDLSLKVALEPLLEHAEGLFILLKQHEQTSPGLPPSISAIMFPKPTNNDENGNDSEGVSPVSSTKSSRDPSPVITTDVVERKTRTRHLTESHSIDENDSAVVSHSQKA